MPQLGTVRDHMTKDLVTARPDTPAYEAIVLLLKNGISGMPVVDEEGKVVGILTERDCLKTLVQAQYHEQPTALVGELMTVDMETVGPDTTILEAAAAFVERRHRRLPVIDKGRLVGQISRRDILRAIQQLR